VVGRVWWVGVVVLLGVGGFVGVVGDLFGAYLGDRWFVGVWLGFGEVLGRFL